MAELIFNHSEEWIEKLTCPMQELSPSEREAVAKHVVSCPECNRILTDFAALPWLLEALPIPELPQGLPPKLLQVWQEEDEKSKSEPTPSYGFFYGGKAALPYEATPIEVLGELPGPANWGTITFFEPDDSVEMRGSSLEFERLIRELKEEPQ